MQMSREQAVIILEQNRNQLKGNQKVLKSLKEAGELVARALNAIDPKPSWKGDRPEVMALIDSQRWFLLSQKANLDNQIKDFEETIKVNEDNISNIQGKLDSYITLAGTGRLGLG